MQNTSWRYRKARRTTLLSVGAGSFLVGLVLVACGVTLPQVAWIVVLISFFVLYHYRQWFVAVPVAVLVGCCLGVLHSQPVHEQLQSYKHYIGKKVVIIGEVVDDATYNDKGQRDMRLTNVRMEGRSPPGVVRVTSLTLEQPRRGDTVRVEGKMYEGFGNYHAAIYFGELHMITVVQNSLEDFRRQFAASLYSVMPEMQASLGLGVLVGLKAQLSDQLSDQLKVLSLTHIVVASGFNLTVLVRVARRLFERLSKFQATAAGLLLMSAFVLITGFSASMSRAALVTGLCLLAWYYGRRVHPIPLLLCAAAVTAAVNPLYLWGDIGWWLSFLAFAGVMLLAPLLQARIFGKKQPKLVGQLVIETVAAQLTTLPLLLALFGSFSVLGLFANVLIVPLVPLAMLFTGIAGVASLWFGAVGAYVALPATWLLTFITQVIALLASVPWAAVSVKIDTLPMVALYGLLLAGGILLWHRTRHDFLARSVVE